MSYFVKIDINDLKTNNLDSSFLVELNQELTCDVIDILKKEIKNFQNNNPDYYINDIIDLTLDCLEENGYLCYYRTQECTIFV